MLNLLSLDVCDFAKNPEFKKLVEQAELQGYNVELRFTKNHGKAKLLKGEGRWHKRYLYKLTFPNGMVYIGTTFDIDKRWDNNGSHYKSQKVWSAIQEFGWNNIEKEILLYIPFDEEHPWSGSDEIRRRERELIKEYDGRCYNVTCTREGGRAIAEATRASGIYERNRKAR